jgi:hypothetical protein
MRWGVGPLTIILYLSVIYAVFTDHLNLTQAFLIILGFLLQRIIALLTQIQAISAEILLICMEDDENPDEDDDDEPFVLPVP